MVKEDYSKAMQETRNKLEVMINSDERAIDRIAYLRQGLIFSMKVIGHEKISKTEK